MDLVSTEQFLEWSTARGIGRSSKYPRSVNLVYPADHATWYRYRHTPTMQPLNAFVALAVTVAAAGSPIWLFPPGRGGQWQSALHAEFPGLGELRAVVQSADVPADFVGAVRFEADDLSVAAQLLAAAIQYAGSLWMLCAIPDHAKCVLQSDEDDDLLGYFPTEAAGESFTHALRRAGWQEPTDPDPRVSETDPWLAL